MFELVIGDIHAIQTAASRMDLQPQPHWLGECKVDCMCSHRHSARSHAPRHQCGANTWITAGKAVVCLPKLLAVVGVAGYVVLIFDGLRQLFLVSAALRLSPARFSADSSHAYCAPYYSQLTPAHCKLAGNE